MKKVIASLVFGLFASGAAQADVINGSFNYLYGTGAIAPAGSITLNLNPNGTVAAHVSMVSTLSLIGVALDSNGHYVASGMPIGSDTSWGTGLGSFNSGIVCYPTNCSNDFSWVIGTTGQFTSVTQLVTGTNSAYDFWAYDVQGRQFGGVVTSVQNAVPEPGSIALFGLALLGLGAVRRKGSQAK